MTKQQRRTKRAEPKFSLGQRLRHVSGVEGHVHEVVTQQHVESGDGNVMVRNLPEAVYTIVYLDNNEILHTFQTREMFFEAVE